MSHLVVIEGSFGKRVSQETEEDNAIVIAELEKWLARAKEKKIVGFGICAITDDDRVMTQYVPNFPRNVFTLIGGLESIKNRLWFNRVETHD